MSFVLLVCPLLAINAVFGWFSSNWMWFFVVVFFCPLLKALEQKHQFSFRGGWWMLRADNGFPSLHQKVCCLLQSDAAVCESVPGRFSTLIQMSLIKASSNRKYPGLAVNRLEHIKSSPFYMSRKLPFGKWSVSCVSPQGMQVFLPIWWRKRTRTSE